MIDKADAEFKNPVSALLITSITAVSFLHFLIIFHHYKSPHYSREDHLLSTDLTLNLFHGFQHISMSAENSPLM